MSTEPVWWWSASQTKTAKLCIRKWFYEKIEKLRPIDESPALVLGKQHSTQVEEYLEGRRSKADCMELVQIGMDLIPDPAVHTFDQDYFVEVECRTNLALLFDHVGLPYDPLFDEGGYIGFIDLLDFTSGKGKVRDHKTRASARWVLREKDLRADVQMGLYATYADLGLLPRWPGGAGAVDVEHINYLKRSNTDAHGRRAFVTKATLTRADMLEVMRDVQKQVRRTLEVRGSDKKPDGDPTYKGCEKFSGCPHQGHCEWYLEKRERERGNRFAGIESAVPPTHRFAGINDNEGNMTTGEDEQFFNDLFNVTPTPPEPEVTEDTQAVLADDEQEVTVGVLSPEGETEFSEMLAKTDAAENTAAIEAGDHGDSPEASSSPEDVVVDVDSQESPPAAEAPDPWAGYPTRWTQRLGKVEEAFGQPVTKEELATWTLPQFKELAIEGLGKGTITNVMTKLAEEFPEAQPPSTPAPPEEAPGEPWRPRFLRGPDSKKPANEGGGDKPKPVYEGPDVSEVLRQHGFMLLLDCEISTDLNAAFYPVRLEALAWAAGEEASRQLGVNYMTPRYNKGFMLAADLLVPMVIEQCEAAFAAQKIPMVMANAASGQRLFQFIENFLMAHARTIIRG